MWMGCSLEGGPLGGAPEGEEESEERGGADKVEGLKELLEVARSEKESLQSEVTDLRQELKREKEKAKELWRSNCIQVAEFDNILSQLRQQLGHTSHVGSATWQELALGLRQMMGSGNPSLRDQLHREGAKHLPLQCFP